ncbi:unnamed protein product [Leuciscus chuanchicus]
MYIQCRALLLKVASGRVDVRYNTAAHLPQLEGSGVTRSAIKMASRALAGLLTCPACARSESVVPTRGRAHTHQYVVMDTHSHTYTCDHALITLHSFRFPSILAYDREAPNRRQRSRHVGPRVKKPLLMSNLLSETFTNAFAKVRLSSDRSAYIPREGGKSTSDVVPFMEVYNKSLCRPREVLVEIQQEYPDDIEHIFIPSCVVLTRCAGCCNDEMMECTPTVTYNITLEIKRLKPLRHQGDFFMSFAEHSECQCRQKKNLPETREKKPRKGKGQKRKRKKNREKKRDLYVTSAFASSHLHLIVSVSLAVLHALKGEEGCLFKTPRRVSAPVNTLKPTAGLDN